MPYPILFEAIFAVNLGGYVIGLLLIDCQLQVAMDDLGGDLHTVASRTLALEAVAEVNSSSSVKVAGDRIGEFALPDHTPVLRDRSADHDVKEPLVRGHVHAGAKEHDTIAD